MNNEECTNYMNYLDRLKARDLLDEYTTLVIKTCMEDSPELKEMIDLISQELLWRLDYWELE